MSVPVRWLEPDAWLAACPEAGALASAPVPAGADDVIAALSSDPRRLAVLAGDPPAASALALAVARAATRAWYPAPDHLPADTVELEALLGGCDRHGRPVIVLDGPRPLEVMALARELVARRLHPRLLVLVPCRRQLAPQLPALAGNYPRRSILVVEVAPDAPGPAGQVADAPTEQPARSRPGGAPPGSLAAELGELGRRAQAAFHAGDPAGAAAMFHQAADGWLALGEVTGAIHALECAAQLDRDLGAHDAAAGALEQALGLCRTIGDPSGEAHLRVRLGEFADRRADPAAAASHYQAALDLLRQLDASPLALERLLGDLAAARAAAAGAGQVMARGPRPPELAPPDDLIPVSSLRRPG